LQSPLERLKLRILHFLGALGGISNTTLVQTSQDASLKSTIAWNTEEFLSFSLPFPDMKAPIFLGKIESFTWLNFTTKSNCLEKWFLEYSSTHLKK